MNHPSTLAAVIAMLAAATTSATPSFPAFDARANAGEKLTVAFFGASLTYGANASAPDKTSYRGQVADKLEAAYPKANFKFIDGAIGGTDSALGVFRLKRDCLDYKPDLVFLVFSANDGIYGVQEKNKASYESLVRRVITEGNCPVVIAIFPFKGDADPASLPKMKGRAAHWEIAKAYGVPVGDVVARVQELFTADNAVPGKLWPFDGAHPGDEGYAIFADVVFAAFQDAVRGGVVEKAPENMLHAGTYMTWSRNRLSQSAQPLPEGWRVEPVSRTSAWYDALMSRWLDDVSVVRAGNPAPLKLRFKAEAVGLFGEETTRSGKIRVLLDGEEAATLDLDATRFGGNRHFNAHLATGLDPEKEHALEIIPLFESENAQEIRLESVLLAGGEARML